MTDKQELLAARLAAVVAIVGAGYLGINPPGFVAQVVAFSFGLAAASFFPAIILGIFYKKMNKEGAIAVNKVTAEVPQDVQDMVESIRYPKGAGEAHYH